MEKPIEQLVQQTSIPESSNIKNKISTFSIKGIQKIKEIEKQQKATPLNPEIHLSEHFSQEDLEKYWNEFAQQLEKKGKKIYLSYMSLSKPIVMGHNIMLEFPNEGSKIDFENMNADLIAYLKTNLKNYDIKIKIKVNEAFKPKVIFTNEDKYNHFKTLNPLIEKFRNTFELDF